MGSGHLLVLTYDDVFSFLTDELCYLKRIAIHDLMWKVRTTFESGINFFDLGNILAFQFHF